ncbi:NAD-glutamate dehydrogenase [Rhodococcus sp. EPR-157]|uniref:NAD-glutamate dehydrogenase domain-containing protein n=1 Tax=Rhodococcus sp. EPR-157 TaxID=1813677 RepID=UPI0007BC0470|nr:NAD-glutamate dehydrogenase domain-containing protein [Rhodococcus sp. EPR-157]KZF03964.1 NAD-glutamate dehydrogenase [Rhodococcus sp. EPR-157]
MKTTTHAAATTLDDYVEIPDEQPKVNTSRVIALGENSVEIDVDASSASAPKITFYSSDGPVSLERVLQLVDSFDLSITDQRTVTLARRDGLICFVHQFSTSARIIDGDNVHDHIESRLADAVRAMWAGWTELDRFAVLVLTAGLDWRDVFVLRAYGRYLKQTNLPHSLYRIQAILLDNPATARALIDLFHAQFDPTSTRDPERRRRLVEDCLARVDSLLDLIRNLDADKVIRAYRGLITATVRTNFHRDGGLGLQRRHLSFKLVPALIDELPQPRPLHEIYVCSPDVEGVHLRFGSVARGGLRWSDRLDDFRTEILGLAKAQSVKNAVIVPAGAKGGFVVRNPPPSTGDRAADRQLLLDEARRCYRQFIAGLLDVTDNLDSQRTVIHPPSVICRDGDDPYLVVAADKGTATFSDLANQVASDYHFWLDDAFASGGSVGYDHKKMGITAAGAWVSATRHLAENGIDAQRDRFTVAAIGDMSGDVFGNGMLSSTTLALVAAFDHRHIFIDPNPDTAASYLERRRLFELPNSSWNDYDEHLISPGGGVFSRETKSIPISPQMRDALDIADDVMSLDPNELIRAVLKAPVDLLFNGGVGTYVKAHSESDSHAGDKANDGVRVDADELRCGAVVEGGNLGVTARGRVEFARAGGKINSDAMDNSAGVDCSDHEVNIKVLLDTVAPEDRLSAADRAHLLASFTDQVGELVLENNRAQNRVLGDARSTSARHAEIHARMIADLETRRGLDRELETLPTAREFEQLVARGEGLTSPQLATLLAHAKTDLSDALASAQVLDDPHLVDRLDNYFPTGLRDNSNIAQHPLRSEILSTTLVNEIFAVGGLTFCFRLREDTGATDEDVLRAYLVANEVFGVSTLVDDIVDAHLAPDAEYRLVVESRRLLDRGARWFLAHARQPLDIDTEISRFGPAVRSLSDSVHEFLRGEEARRMQELHDDFTAIGAGHSIARGVAVALYKFSLLDIVEVADECIVDVSVIARVYFALSDRLRVDRWLVAVSALEPVDNWHTLARMTLREDLYQSLRLLVHGIARHGLSEDPDESIDIWARANRSLVDRANRQLNELDDARSHSVASLVVAARQLRGMTG